jgi:hypothetical protein
MGESLVAATISCIAIGCQSDADGETDFTLGDASDVDPGHLPIFEGNLLTPNRRIAVQSVLGATILETAVPRQQTFVTVWVNDSTVPDQVIIGIA